MQVAVEDLAAQRLDDFAPDEAGAVRLQEIADSVPAAPATEPTLVQVRDEVTDAAKEATLQLVGAAIGDTAKEATQLEVNSKLETRIPVELGTSGGIKVEGIAASPPALAPTQFEALGSIQCGTTAQEITFTLQTRVVIIQADFDNTGYILVGSSFVNPAGEHALCKLAAGDTIAIEYNDANNPLYIVATLPGQVAIAGATTEP